MEERSSASAVRPDAERLARRALACLEEVVREGIGPSGSFLRPGLNVAAVERPRLEKIPVLNPERNGSILPRVLLVPKALGRAGTQSTGRGREGFQGSKGEIMKN